METIQAHDLTRLSSFQWKPGMQRLRWNPARLEHLTPMGRVGGMAPTEETFWNSICVPDLNDPATMGLLFLLAVELYEQRGYQAVQLVTTVEGEDLASLRWLLIDWRGCYLGDESPTKIGAIYSALSKADEHEQV